MVELRGDGFFQSSRSNDAGSIVFDHVPDGVYKVLASHRDYERLEESLDLVGGQGRTVRWLSLQLLAP
jgi:hypothetical protein